MAKVRYRANLSAKSIPLLSELQGRTVIVKGQDQSYMPQMVLKEEADKDLGVPQVFYAHNVLPNTYGFQSVGYDTFLTNTGITDQFISTEALRDASGNNAALGITSSNTHYVLEYGSSNWVGTTIASSAGKQVSVAYVSGVTYIYFSGLGCYKYDFATHALVSVTLTGLDPTKVLFIAGKEGYLLAYSIDAVAWSSTVDPTDFTPSLISGAGGGSIEGAKGALVFARSVYSGVIVFTTSNAVAMISSGNPRFPFNFTEITGAGGLINPEYVTTDASSGTVYAYTSVGLQTVSLRKAETVNADVTDFLSGSYFEDFDENTLTFTTSTSNVATKKKVTIVVNRYLILSYGLTELTHAIVYDLVLKQFGKLKINHVDCFEFQMYDQGIYETPKKSVGFLLQDGSIKILNTDLETGNSKGLMILGKYQYVRARLLQLQKVEVENIPDDKNFSLYNLASLDGKSFLPATAGYLENSGSPTLAKSFAFHVTGLNHSLIFKGRFNAVTLQLTFNVHGAK